MADEPTQTPAQFNQDALASRVTQQVLGGIQGMRQQEQQQAQQAQAQQQQAVQAQRAQAQAAGDPIYNAVVKPYVEPLARQISIQSQGAMDGFKFYHQHPDAVKYMDALEGQFNQMAGQGMPFDRATIWNHYRGQNFDHFAKEQAEQVARAAAQGANVGPAGMGRPELGAFDMESFKRMTPEDRKKALENVTF